MGVNFYGKNANFLKVLKKIGIQVTNYKDLLLYNI